MDIEDKSVPTPIFWGIALLALIWNLMGVGAFFMLVNATSERLIELYGAEQAAIIAAYPVWYNIVFALAVFGGVIGSVLLLLRQKLAIWPFLVSFISTVIQFLYLIFVGALSGFTASEWLMPILIPIVAGLLVRHTLKNIKRGFLK